MGLIGDFRNVVKQVLNPNAANPYIKDTLASSRGEVMLAYTKAAPGEGETGTPDKLRAILKTLDARQLESLRAYIRLSQHPEFQDPLKPIDPSPATQASILTKALAIQKSEEGGY
jgi:hypothetical protein